MEYEFDKTQIAYLEQVVNEIQNLEQTQELKLSDGMPDIERILGSWGQVVIRSKEWRSDSILLSGGIMVWVLYKPEENDEPKSMESWIPFQMKWDLPDGVPDGDISIGCQLRFVDARSVSPRKIMIRAGISAIGEAYVKTEKSFCNAEKAPESVELLHRRYTIKLPKAAGEKYFEIDEEIHLDADETQQVTVVYCTLTPEVTDQKVLGNKIAFRGNTNLHVLLKAGDGRLSSEYFPLPFSQISEMDEVFGSDSDVSIRICVTNLETDILSGSQIGIKCSLTGQYVVSDIQNLDVVEDAYAPGRELSVKTERLDLPVRLESSREHIGAEQAMPVEFQNAVDFSYIQDYPHFHINGSACAMVMPTSVQVLYYDNQNQLQTTVIHWDGQTEIRSDDDTQISGIILHPAEEQLNTSGGRASLKINIPVDYVVYSNRGIDTVSAVEVGEVLEPDSTRPSLILRRAGTEGLWTIAKNCSSTVNAIQKANNLENEPLPNQMLLIPVI